MDIFQIKLLGNGQKVIFVPKKSQLNAKDWVKLVKIQDGKDM